MKTTKQHALLVITTIEKEHREALEELLGDIVTGDVEDNEWIPFKSLKTIHFARLFILPATTDVKGQPIPDQLLFSTNYDGPLDEHLAELVDVAGESGLDEIYKHCKGYPAQPTAEKRIAYLRAHQAKYSTFYVGTVGRTVGQIRRENELHDAIEDLLDSGDGWNAMAPADIRTAIQDFAFEKFEWAKTEPPDWLTPRTRLLASWIRFIANNLQAIALALISIIALLLFLEIIPRNGFGVLLSILLCLVLLFLFILRYKEQADKYREAPLGYSCPDVADLIAREDLTSQNQMTGINNMKPGFFRLSVERVVQAAINFAARYISNEGDLAGIPSIHFARWCIIDKGRRLLFLSNFDGSWENYLSDFVDKSATGLTAVWSHTVIRKMEDGFPNTAWLLEKGAKDEQRFKGYARASQVATNVWYTAYKELSVQNINNNSMIRKGLHGDLSPKETMDWLHRL